MKNKKDKEINTEELNEVIGLSKKILKLLYFVFIACLILAIIIAAKQLTVMTFVIDLLKVISPFFIGFILAWLLKPLAERLNKYVKNKTLSAIMVFAVFVLALFGILYIFVPTVYNEVNELVGLLPGFVESITKNINNIFKSLAESGLNLADFQQKLLSEITSFSAGIAKSLPNTIINIVVSLFGGIGTFLMGLIIGVYMLIDYDSISDHFKKLFPKRVQGDVHNLAARMSVEVRRCVNGTFLVALVVLVCDSIGFALVGLNAPLLFGLLCGLTDLIPFIGPYIGGATAVIVGLTQSPLIGIGTLIICVIVQIFENYILQPIIMSKASQTHPIAIIIALLVFGHFFGILGMILAAPILTIARVIFDFAKEKLANR